MSELNRAIDPMDLVRPAKPVTILTRLMAIGLISAAVVLAFTPWRQTAAGKGRVIAFAPSDRRQNLEAPIEGRVLRWMVREGSRVKKGDVVVELTDNDAAILSRLRSERDSVARRIEANRTRSEAIEERAEILMQSRTNGVAAADARTRMATQRVLAAAQARDLAIAALETARVNAERQRSLASQGLASQRQVELASLEETRARTDLDRATAVLASSRDEEAALAADRLKVQTDASAALNDALASRAAAESEVANAAAELARIEVRLARQSAQTVTAPSEGTIFKIVANGQSGETVKAGDTLAVLVPDVKDRAVELLISGNDLPLVSDGSPVRLQFEGWPALQFSGWPSVAVGTFGGTVSLIDAADDGNGSFRILVTPVNEADWPDTHWLKQGARVHGWVQLGEVSLGYELWRQFNGFPQSLQKPPATPKDKS